MGKPNVFLHASHLEKNYNNTFCDAIFRWNDAHAFHKTERN